MNFYINVIRNVIYFAFSSLVIFTQCKEPASLNALVISDQQDKSNKNIQTILENTGLFDVDVENGASPSFSNYDVVVMNVEKGSWEDDTRQALQDYVTGGGGVVVLGNSGDAFTGWNDFLEIVGLNEPSNGKSNDTYDYRVVNLNEDHPVTNGLNKLWVHNDDFLLFRSTVLADNAEVLSVVNADTIYGGSGESVPVLFTNQYGEGRIFHSTLGNNEENSLLSR